MNEKQKILVCGDVEGRFNTFFTRVENINKKSGPFDMVLCVGNFFGVNNVEFEDYKKYIKQVSIPTYVLGPNTSDHIECYPNDVTEFCPNVQYLGKRGVFRSSGGLKIAYLSGVPSTNIKDDPKPYEFTKTDVFALRDSCLKGQANFRGIDILLTSTWPQNVANLDTKCTLKEEVPGSELISWLASEIKPRYHICGLQGTYYERAPYRNLGTQGEEKGEIATRFLGMARVNNPQKQKWVYALSLTPVDQIKLTDLYQQTTDETPCPYDMELLQRAGGKSQSVQFFYNMNAPMEDDRRKRRNNREDNPRKKQRPVFDQNKCWFCLASPEVEKHLVISVGEEVYLALAKGGLVDEHLLILPVEHHQSAVSLPESVLNEMNKFKTAIQQYFETHDQVPIFFERNYKTSHLQIQVIPIPKRALRELADIFKDEGEANGIKLETLPPNNRLDQMVPAGCPYFCVELPDQILFTRCKAGFPLQFGREVLATGPVLNAPERVEWKDCILPRNEEDQLVQRIRNHLILQCNICIKNNKTIVLKNIYFNKT